LKKLLLIRNKQNQNFHHTLLANKFNSVEKSLEILENLLKVVGKDQDFFKELTEQDVAMPEEIKEFLETNFEIDLEVNLQVVLEATAKKEKSKKKKCNIM
jgi:hypothetical protein